MIQIEMLPNFKFYPTLFLVVLPMIVLPDPNCLHLSCLAVCMLSREECFISQFFQGTATDLVVQIVLIAESMRLQVNL